SIKAATSFFESLENFIGIIAYWSSSYVAIVLLEHVYFRSSDPATYIREYFDQPRLLPTGVAAIAAGVGSFGLVIPCMSQIWYTGPIAVHTGDIGFEVAFVVTALLYIPFRTLEIKWLGRR
ncbi:Purine-cytosine permease, partial [Pseudohyphozyma bogoriensis]